MEKYNALQTSDTDTINLASDPINTDVHNAGLTGKETRQMVTPYAFFVADELLGTRLAGPFRRGLGMLIDLIFVGLLTQVSSLVLATGLLGFLQVFWDPNRQAIQDKISETLVIDLRHPKKPFDQA